jgi:hypothetical protein
MPRPKPCQHHLRHENAVNLSKGHHSVSLKLLKCMREGGEGDSVGGWLQSTTRRHILLKNIPLPSTRDIYVFAKKQLMETARAHNKNEPSVHVFFLATEEIK